MTVDRKEQSEENRSDGSGLYLPVFLKIMDYHREMEARDQTHAMTELVIVMKGSCELICNGMEIPIDAGDVFIIPPGCRHHYNKPEKMCLAGILFDALRLPMPKLDLPLLPGYHAFFMTRDRQTAITDIHRFSLSASQYKNLVELLKMMREECDHQSMGANFRLLGLFMALLGNLCAMYDSGSGGSGRSQKTAHEKLSPVLDFMNRKYLSPITFEDLLARASMSRSSLKRAFLRVTGVSPMHYLQRLRLEHAMRLLALTDLSVSEVAFASGFNDSNYFTRAFKKLYRISPRDYRAMPIPAREC